ncbi:major cardiolipin synthase ClsA [Paraliobacillus ryukyuensis]|uniref:Cardiolipin synthase n=1 Tax=Paraliobacillus ryukyuensis TaxID=200904 RepID=A0A366EFG8_9BACI|nr:cardiolipin synthase [Paraliobacillus ryukyuensis]RBP00480.1 cardiolipin synthase [Paraliobacillus ryukyuensis]
MGITTIILWFSLIFNIFLAFAIVFLERKSATSTWAWLMVLLFIPVAGFIIYLIFGRKLSGKKLFIWDNKSRLGVQKAVQIQLELLEQGNFPIPKSLQKYQDLFYLHLRNDDAILTQGNEVEIFTDGKKKFDALIADLEQAKDHIHLIYYIVRNDALGQRIADTLIRKAREGVKVRFLYDDMGSRRLKRKYINRLKDAGVEVESFFPPLIPKVNLKINYRNHRKLAIIDGKIGYIGGFNIGDEYLGQSKKFGYWRDTHLRIVGESVRNMQTRYILDWNQASRNDIVYEDRYYQADPKGNVGIQIVSSGPDSEWEQIKNGYIKMIMEAKEFIYIQTPYFIPDDSLADALRIAVLSGVDVRIMIPNKPDHPFVYWATYSYIGELLKAGAKVYIYNNGFLHAKTIVVDGEIASVGTANIDVRSFRLNFEVNAFLYSEKVANRLVYAYHQDIRNASPLTLEAYIKRSLWIRFKESISRLISPIL